MNTSNAYKYEEVYEGLKKFGKNPILLQSFALNNNADIIKAIDYWKQKKGEASDEEQVRINDTILRLENIMLERLRITEDMFATELPLMQQGPAQKEPKKKEKKETKVIEHPASKDKKKTVNEKVGEEIVKKKKKEETFKTDYDKLYRTDEDKLNAINSILPSVEKDLTNGIKDLEGEDLKKKVTSNEATALRKLKYHLKSYGDMKKFATEEEIKRIIKWLQSGTFQSRSPFDVLRGNSLSIADLINEAKRATVEIGMGETELKDYMKPFILDATLKEQEKNKKMVSTEEEYDNFFRSSLSFLLDKDTLAKNIAEYDNSHKSKEDVMAELYEQFKETGYKCIIKMAKVLQKWVRQNDSKGKEYSLNSALAESSLFIKPKDPKMFEEYIEKRSKQTGTGGGKKKSSEEPKEEVVQDNNHDLGKEETEETIQVDGKQGKTNVTPSPSVYPKLEDLLKYRVKKPEISEFLISIVNKKLNPIGQMVNGVQAQIEALTTLAKKKFLEQGAKDEDGKELSDWTEKDVLQYMAEDIVPYITDEYGILKCENDKELKEELKFYIEKYPVGNQDNRTKALKEVLISKIPRTKHMKKVARSVRKGDMGQLNTLFKEIGDEEIKKAKEKNKK